MGQWLPGVEGTGRGFLYSGHIRELLGQWNALDGTGVVEIHESMHLSNPIKLCTTKNEF